MITLQLPHSSGIYQIRCIPTGKVYIGSATNLFKRWSQHRRSLRRGEHRNLHLQYAWDKHGEPEFVFEIIEFVDVSHLLEAEQEWIDSTGCADKEIGFNIRDTAESSGRFNAQIWEGFIDPEGKAIVIINLHDFCREYKLDFPSMHRLAKGESKLKSYKGWTHRNSVRQRDYIKTYEGFVDPEGNIISTITNLAEFCRDHELDNTHMLAVMNGRICSHRGWTHINGRARRERKTYLGFIDPSGKQVAITNLAEFCRENGLHPVKMHNLKSGKIQRYKGWTWSNNDECTSAKNV